jgi:caffeoyl-CoA O-methyltransferase
MANLDCKLVMGTENVHPAILTGDVEHYLERIQRPRSGVLVELERDAKENKVPICGPVIGTTLSILASCTRAKNILEIGTATGYSGIWLLKGIGDRRGKLTTIEMDPERYKKARLAFEKARLLDGRVDMMLGDASKLVPQIAKKNPGKFDVVFMDVGAKELFSELLDDCLLALKERGLFIVDDTLYRGVAISSIKDDKAKIMRSFNKRLFDDKRVEPQILSVGDGLTIAVKL